MVKINFTCVAPSDSAMEDKVYVVTKDIEATQSLREVCKEIYLDLIVNEGVIDRTGNLEEVELFGLNMSLKQKHSDKQFFPNFRLGDQGEVIFFEGIEMYTYDWNLKELYELHNEGYLKGEEDEIIFEPPFTGFGAEIAGVPIDEILKIFEIISALNTLYGGVKWTTSYISDYKAKKEIKEVAKKWENEQGIYSVPQLRKFIEEHGPWTIAKLKKALQIKEEFAHSLLYNLGYDPQGDIWVARVSEDGLKRYAAWIEGEKEAIEERNKNLQE
ncbi:hypothetical protein ACI1TM_07225 [Lactococcus garvieae]|uniref:hypothetical protein n=1 Tax=Lactococcus garvieae TaxID=1363 RepID=UPI003851B163